MNHKIGKKYIVFFGGSTFYFPILEKKKDTKKTTLVTSMLLSLSVRKTIEREIDTLANIRAFPSTQFQVLKTKYSDF